MKFSLITVNYNGGARIAKCMQAAATQSFTDFEMLVVDNASTDTSRQTPVPDDRFRWIDAGGNLGFAAGNNLAAKQAQGEWLFLVNPDAYLEPECLATLHAATLRHPTCPLFGCTQLDDEFPDLLDGGGDCYYFAGLPWRGGKGWEIEALPDEGEVWGPCGAAYLIRRDIFESLGGFDEDFFCYCEDVDLNFRMHLQGYKAIQVVEAFMRHEGSGITGAASPFSDFHGMR
ncbi:MAG TPA: glycosyltransferase family 2 protein, partial [Alphaproteobacteria bacterium]|nr:glycosyltransferase family 2 protein [Alphaproteobacteria bacterium]